MSFLLWLIYAVFVNAKPGIVNLLHQVKMEADFEFVALVPITGEVSSQWTGATGTSENPCAAPEPCVQFYPPRASFRIIGKPDQLHAALILTPQQSNLPTIAVAMVKGDVWFPAVLGAQCTMIINFEDDISDSRIFSFDEDIKDIIR
uniref:Uncharacterized protein n=1 Tax=Schistocephalus solidus TaxID=70667 RepID=A0A0X3P2J5_SCHSO